MLEAKIYQELFVTPGTWPLLARFLKQIRQRLKSRINARARPHNGQRFIFRELNFGLILALYSFAHVDMVNPLLLLPEWVTHEL